MAWYIAGIDFAGRPFRMWAGDMLKALKAAQHAREEYGMRVWIGAEYPPGQA